MSHQRQRDFILSVRKRQPTFFYNVRVLDVGSLDVNGNNRDFFTDSEYLGIDVVPGKNVDRVARIEDIQETFRVVICTEVLEHYEKPQKLFQEMIARVEPGGMLLVTCAGPKRPEHGTRKHPIPGMVCETDYYRGITTKEMSSWLKIQDWKDCRVLDCADGLDTQFWGIKL